MTEKTIRILYWVFTILFSAMMLLSAIPDIMNEPDAISFMNGILQYPVYIIPFIGWAKVLGVIAIVYPKTPINIKEWAYAGLAFSLIFAFISHSCVDRNIGYMVMPLVFLGILAVSYIYNHTLKKS